MPHKFMHMVKDRLEFGKLSARRAALKEGLPIRAIQNVLDGHDPKLARAAEICEALGLEFYIGPPRVHTELVHARSLPEDMPVSDVAPVSDRTIASIVSALADAYEKLNPEGRKMFASRFGYAFPELQENMTTSVEVGKAVTILQRTGPGGKVNQLPGTRHIEIRELAAAAGGGAADLGEEIKGYLAFRRTWLEHHGLDAAQCSVIQVSGESMEPILPDGCSILVNLAEKRRRKGHIFVVRGKDGLIVKRAGRDKHGGWLLESDHPAWKSIPWGVDSEVVGEVRWVARTLG